MATSRFFTRVLGRVLFRHDYVLLAYNPGLVGATDLPDAWCSRFLAVLEVAFNWAALAALGAPQRLVGEALALDRRRLAGEDGLAWTPQFRDVEALWRMSERVGERAALAFFASNLAEQVASGAIAEAHAAAACRIRGGGDPPADPAASPPAAASRSPPRSRSRSVTSARQEGGGQSGSR